MTTGDTFLYKTKCTPLEFVLKQRKGVQLDTYINKENKIRFSESKCKYFQHSVLRRSCLSQWCVHTESTRCFLIVTNIGCLSYVQNN